jgi:hypothetical protein
MNVEYIMASQLKGKILAVLSNIRGMHEKYIPIAKIKKNKWFSQKR